MPPSPQPQPDELTRPTVGKTLAYTQVTFWDKERNLVARGSHTKSVTSLSNLAKLVIADLAQDSWPWLSLPASPSPLQYKHWLPKTGSHVSTTKVKRDGFPVEAQHC
jgi:hypothetical protein